MDSVVVDMVNVACVGADARAILACRYISHQPAVQGRFRKAFNINEMV